MFSFQKLSLTIVEHMEPQFSGPIYSNGRCSGNRWLLLPFSLSLQVFQSMRSKSKCAVTKYDSN